MRRGVTIILIIITTLTSERKAIAQYSAVADSIKTSIMFWNLENYFDPFDDTLTRDEEFVFGGVKHWTWSRFEKKRNDISKIIVTTHSIFGQYPAFIGLSELENYMVLSQLTQKTILSKLGYKIIHQDSHDERGIDVAALYRPDFLKILSYRNIEITLPDTSYHTRPILYVKGCLTKTLSPLTVYLLVNHWPSKWGGEEKSRPNRMAAAKVLRHIKDSLLINDPNALILAMGDFNDTPYSLPVQYVLKGQNFHILALEKNQNKIKTNRRKIEDNSDMVKVYDEDKTIQGTIRYKGNWEQIDIFMVSDALLKILQKETIENRKSPLDKEYTPMILFDHPYIMEKDATYLGRKPRRTYIGPIYHGGVSDHLPIIINF